MPKASSKPMYIDEIKRLYLNEKHSLSEIAQILPVSVQTMSRWLTEDGVQLEARPRNPNAGRTAQQQERINQRIKNTYQAKAEAGYKHQGRRRTVEREDRVCPSCQTHFEVLATSNKKYCSMHCARFEQARRKQAEVREAWYAGSNSDCLCGKKIPYEHRDTWKYCSPECRETYGAKRQPDPLNQVTFTCQNESCGQTVTRYKNYGSGHDKYCSYTCAQKHTKTKKHIVVDNAVVLDSNWESLFWGLCGFRKVPIERFDRSHAVIWKDDSWYGPDFTIPLLDGLAVEVKGQPDSDDLVKWSAYRAQRGELVVLLTADLDRAMVCPTRTDLLDFLTDLARQQNP